ncbi:hypothetical protein DDZ16_00055 [Marinilabilia rubra]|uniref:Uncharacterized protein n=1 Tax=Marinilabilia rubra TaxID=2162893 RepID=A0A2U2BCY3_9BACT|nr:hypothetical protein DDZ16_00055 [Marinilabilia rubra]
MKKYRSFFINSGLQLGITVRLIIACVANLLLDEIPLSSSLSATAYEYNANIKTKGRLESISSRPFIDPY